MSGRPPGGSTCGIAKPGVEIAGREGAGRGPANTCSKLRRMGELGSVSMILRGHRPGEIERPPGYVRVDIHTSRKDDHAGRIDRANASFSDLLDDPSA